MTTYGYDGMNQLAQETRAEFGAASQSLAYAYDDFGNRKTLTASGPENYTVSYTYDRNNRLLEDAKTEGGKVVRTSYFYDPNGNQTAKAIDTYSSAAGEQSISLSDVLDSGELSMYNGFNQLVKTCVNGTTVSYEYAPSGLRLSKTVADKTTSFVLDSGYVMLELQDGAVTGNYVRALNLVADTSGGSVVYYLYNGHSDVVQLTDSTGAVVRSYEYDAFGNELEPDEEDGNPFRYCAEYFDAETGRIYLRARYYDPVIGRFSTEDPIGYGTNWYLYCLSNPLVFHDSSGFAPKWLESVIGDFLDSEMFQWYTEQTQSGAADWFLNLSLGAQKDKNGVYHLRQDWWQSWKLVGYNEFYDYMFDAATSMKADYFDFKHGDQNFRLWAWKGHYTNLGAGAEIGIYYGNNPHWFTGTDYAMPMTLRLVENNGKEVFYWDPGKPNWWITGFLPTRQDLLAEDLTAIYTLNFSQEPEMYESFAQSSARFDSRWKFNPRTHTATFTF